MNPEITKDGVPDTTIEITKDGVAVGGHVLHGVYGYDVHADPAAGVFEVSLKLVTSKCRIDLGDGHFLVGGGRLDPLVHAQMELARVKAKAGLVVSTDDSAEPAAG